MKGNALLWLILAVVVIAVIAAVVATVAVTVVAGPLNYLGVNPKVKCRFPQPSS